MADERLDPSSAQGGAVPESPARGAGSDASARSIPAHPGEVRNLRVKRTWRSAWARALTAIAALAAFVAGTVQWGVGAGALLAGVTVLVALVVTFLAASRGAQEEYTDAYADGRGLERQPRGRLQPSTPLLGRGDHRYAEQVMSGTLPGGMDGVLAHYTYEEHVTDSEGRREVEHHRCTVVVHQVAALDRISELRCERRSGFRWADSLEDASRRMRRLELESEPLDRHYEIFYGADDDELWLRQLFSPSFIVWLAERPPPRPCFELAGGTLCVHVDGHLDNTEGLDRLCEESAVIARRLREEAAE